ncbi:unnamed protein product [Calicophoron daubneyi]|uniref:Noggin n=1 Tax=Calicophoron daubneyi TaxID=300641 RepID=A0AAV2TQY5_CALDB
MTFCSARCIGIFLFLCFVPFGLLVSVEAYTKIKSRYGFSQRSPPTDVAYGHGQINIQMSKIPPPLRPSLSSREGDSRASSNHMEPNKTDYPQLNIGGLGLASTAQSHISLGSLSSSLKSVSAPMGIAMSRPSQQEISEKQRGEHETVKVVWPDHHYDSDNPRVSVQVMGQSIDPQVVNHLNPDVSPSKARKLRRILAGSLDREWTSETPPRILRQRGLSGSIGKGTDGNSDYVDTKLVQEANNLNFTFRQDSGDQIVLPEMHIQLFRNWLIDKATCEMDFIWEDLGPLFWPRWIRRGVCVNRQSHSCSWPPGMKCRPSGSRALQLLHWKCEDAAQIQTRKRAAEQRNRRRTVSNTFQSMFYDMKPVQSQNGAHKSLPRLSMRDTETTISLSKLQPYSPHSSREFPLSNDWSDSDVRQIHGGEVTMTRVSREEKKKRRARRLIKRLSVTANGYHCYWQVQKYLISDRCACLCS